MLNVNYINGRFGVQEGLYSSSHFISLCTVIFIHRSIVVTCKAVFIDIRTETKLLHTFIQNNVHSNTPCSLLSTKCQDGISSNKRKNIKLKG